MEAVAQDRTTEARNLLVTALQALQQARQALAAQLPNEALTRSASTRDDQPKLIGRRRKPSQRFG